MKVEELRAIAKEHKMPGAWKAKKSEMIAFLEEIGYESAATESAQDAVENANDEVIEEKEEAAQNEPETKEDNGWELIAKQQLNNAYNWIVGGNENAVSDGDMTEEEFNKWIANEALEEVYHEAITTKYHEDACGGPAPTEMRFAGKKFCRNYLSGLFEKDGYEVEQSKKGKDLIEYNGKTQNLSQWAKELGMPGQTLFARLYMSHWTVEKAFTTPVKKRNKKEEA